MATPQTTTPANPGHPSGSKPEKPARPKKKGGKGKNYNQIHSKPLPLTIHPLPAFHPSNPISLLRLAYAFFSHIFTTPLSHPDQQYVGYFSPETRSVHITTPGHVKALWEMGFFGKGTLSRSEPSWLEREKARLRREKFGAEDATAARREERRAFKLERARVEAERIARQRDVEEGRLDSSELEVESKEGEAVMDASANDGSTTGTRDSTAAQNGSIVTGNLQTQPGEPPEAKSQELKISKEAPEEEYEDLTLDILNQEHLTLTMEEAFFLTYSLRVLAIYPPPAPNSPPMSPKSSPRPYTTRELLQLFIQHTPFPPTPPFDLSDFAPDDEFLLNYVAYHHFRSLGWVIRPGIKFGATYLLYNRGPAFSHAEFAVLVLPAYTDRFWQTPGGRMRRREDAESKEKDWWWLHAVNRVQSQVKKTLVLCFVDVPSPLELALDLDVEIDDPAVVDIGRLLRAYRVREVVVRRWVPNRTRD